MATPKSAYSAKPRPSRARRYTLAWHDRRWRPRTPQCARRPACGYTFDGRTCRRRGAHYCQPRADRVAAFFAELLVHTKGRWARRAFDLEVWQEHDIIRPLFGEVIWSPEWGDYVRRYTVAGIIVARKNGKSELAAGIALYLLIGDDEEAAEVYGAAKDTKQAKKVWEPAKRMRDLSPELAGRLGVNINDKRIFDKGDEDRISTGSYYEVITADAMGELGHNPHGFVLDEVLSQPSDALWNASRTAAGTRHQPMFLVISTETNLPVSFGASMIDELERIAEDPKRNPRWFTYVRKLPTTEDDLKRVRHRHRGHPDLPVSLDPFDERNWRWPNPALGQFLSRESLTQEALEALNDPTKENAFRQFRVNQRVQQVTRWMPLHLWDDAGGNTLWNTVDELELKGQRAFGGLDLAATSDLAALAWHFPSKDELVPARTLFRIWCPESRVPYFNEHTGGQFELWARQGLVRICAGDWIEFSDIREVLDRDLRQFRVVEVAFDPWGAPDTVQWLESKGVLTYPTPQTYQGLSAAMHELMRLVRAHRYNHGANPVIRWMADGVQVKHPPDQPDVIKPVRPKRDASGVRIDGIIAGLMALGASMRAELETPFATASAAGAEAGPTVGDTFRPSGRLDI